MILARSRPRQMRRWRLRGCAQSRILLASPGGRWQPSNSVPGCTEGCAELTVRCCDSPKLPGQWSNSSCNSAGGSCNSRSSSRSSTGGGGGSGSSSSSTGGSCVFTWRGLACESVLLPRPCWRRCWRASVLASLLASFWRRSAHLCVNHAFPARTARPALRAKTSQAELSAQGPGGRCCHQEHRAVAARQQMHLEEGLPGYRRPKRRMRGG
jgi:hypothetical protein